MKLGKKTRATKELTRAERNRRNSLRRTTVSLAVAFVLFIALTVIQSSILNQEKKESVYQVIKNIETNTRITEDNFSDYFKLKQVQVSLIPEDYITDKKDIIGKYITRSYKVNDIVTIDGIKDTEKDYKDDIENPIEISFDVSNLSSGVAGTLREGDFINIYGIARAEGNNAGKYELDKDVSFENVYVAAAFDGSGNKITSLDISDSNTVTMITLIISEDDAAKFTNMISNCQIHIAKVLYNDENKKESSSNNKEIATETNNDATENEEDDNSEKESENKSESINNIEETTDNRDVTVPTGDNGDNEELNDIFN